LCNKLRSAFVSLQRKGETGVSDKKGEPQGQLGRWGEKRTEHSAGETERPFTMKEGESTYGGVRRTKKNASRKQEKHPK